MLSDIFYSDTNTRLSIIECATAIQEDGVLPTKKELEELCMGDETGEIPFELRLKFPNIDKLLDGLS